MLKRSCFVIIGYGKKVSYANGRPRVLDLDETFTVLVKPVFDELGIPCYRAIDKNINGSIDRLMLKEIKEADIALVDISTLNANVMWELGVRHALKSKYTIVICEKEQMARIPFDINHFVVHQYTHSEEGIPFREVDRFKKYLSEAVLKMLSRQGQDDDDSPVFSFLKELMHNEENVISAESFASIMEKAESAKNDKDFDRAIALFEKAREIALANMTLRDNLIFIISRQALCTYKKDPANKGALEKAREILEELKPARSQDIEVIGLSGAISKRLNEVTAEDKYLDEALDFYERGFQLKQDYYNGINTAFMLYKKAGILKKQNNEEWEDLKLKTDYVRNTVLDISRKLESLNNFSEAKDAVWILLTIAEAYNYKGNKVKQKEYEDKAIVLANEKKDKFSIGAYEEQKAKIENDIFHNLG